MNKYVFHIGDKLANVLLLKHGSYFISKLIQHYH